MNHSMRTADRATHLKIVALALVFSAAVLLVGSAARVVDHAARSAAASGPVIKASRIMIFTDGASAIR